MLISVAFATEQSQLSSDGDFSLFTSQMNDLFRNLAIHAKLSDKCLSG